MNSSPILDFIVQMIPVALFVQLVQSLGKYSKHEVKQILPLVQDLRKEATVQ
jgi:hypothetical protein